MSSQIMRCFIENQVGYDIAQWWVWHQPNKSYSADTATNTGLNNGQTQGPFNITVVSNTDDIWTVMWTDKSGNLFGSAYLFNAEVDMDDGDVTVFVSSTPGNWYVSILQNNKDRGSSEIRQYGSGTSGTGQASTGAKTGLENPIPAKMVSGSPTR